MPVKNSFIAKARWNIAQKRVDNAAGTLAKHKLSYSRSAGLLGDISKLSKRELKAVGKSTKIMAANNAGFYTTKKSFTKESALHAARHVPLKISNYQDTQLKAAELSYSSSHLRAGLKFLQRTLYDARLECTPNRRRLGITPEESQEWAANTEAEWRCDKVEKDWDYGLSNDYAQISDMALGSYLSIGEFFAIRRLHKEKDRITGTSLQLISPFQVSSPFMGYTSYISYQTNNNKLVKVPAQQYLSELPNGNYINSGIEYNSKDQEIAIYIAPSDWKDGWMRIPIKNRNGFVQVLHGFIQNEPGQKRGFSESALAWHEYMNIKDLEIFELEAAKINATIAGTVTADSNAQPNGLTPMNDLGTTPNWEDEPSGEVDPLAEYKPPNYSVRKVESSGYVVQNFTPGYTYKELKTDRPNVNIGLFIEKILEYVYPSTLGLSVVVVKQRFDGSYNASKGAIDISWKNGIEYHLKHFASDWHNPNFNAWLLGKVASGRIVARGFEDRYLRSAWETAHVITPPKPSLNPLQEAKGASERVKSGFSNRELESQQLTGTSAEENAERLEQENIRLKKANSVFEDTENEEKLDTVELVEDIKNA